MHAIPRSTFLTGALTAVAALGLGTSAASAHGTAGSSGAPSTTYTWGTAYTFANTERYVYLREARTGYVLIFQRSRSDSYCLYRRTCWIPCGAVPATIPEPEDNAEPLFAP